GVGQPGFAARRAEAGSVGDDYSDSIGRNKRSVLLNLADGRGREIFCRLAADADVIVESFRPGVVKKLGVDYDAIRTFNPRVVYCSFSGFGQDGPYATVPAHDLQFEAIAGLLPRSRDGKPAVPSNLWADRLAANQVVSAILLALLARERQG